MFFNTEKIKSVLNITVNMTYTIRSDVYLIAVELNTISLCPDSGSLWKIKKESDET